jgi:hypothetical protein
MNDYKKGRGYTDGGEIREGENANIDGDTRSRAMAMVERLNKGKDVESAPARATRKAAARPAMTDTGDESARLAGRSMAKSEAKPEPKSYNDVPSIDEVRSSNKDRQSSTSTGSRIKDNAGKVLAGLGMAGGAAMGFQAGRSIMAARKAARAAKDAAKAREMRRAPRDMDDARFADEGNPNYAKGGMVEYAKGGMVGCSPRDYGKK